MSAVETVKIMGMGIIIALLGVMAINRSGPANAADSASAGKIIALTNSGRYFFLIDTETQHIAVYSADDIGFGFSSARKYTYDIGIDEIDKFSRKGYTLKEAEKMYKDNLNTKSR